MVKLAIHDSETVTLFINKSRKIQLVNNIQVKKRFYMNEGTGNRLKDVVAVVNFNLKLSNLFFERS
jgi:hypothetical protein